MQTPEGSHTRESLMDAPVEGQIAHLQPRLSQLEAGRTKFVRFRTFTVRPNVSVATSPQALRAERHDRTGQLPSRHFSSFWERGGIACG